MPERKVGGLSVADANLDIVECAGVAGVEGEIEGWATVRGDASQGKASSEEAEGGGEQGALHQAGGDEGKRDGDVA